MNYPKSAPPPPTPRKKGPSSHGRTSDDDIPMTDTIRRLVAEQVDSARLFEAGRAGRMRTLHEAAVEKVFQGVTTVSEMVRVTGK